MLLSPTGEMGGSAPDEKSKQTSSRVLCADDFEPNCVHRSTFCCCCSDKPSQFRSVLSVRAWDPCGALQGEVLAEKQMSIRGSLGWRSYELTFFLRPSEASMRTDCRGL